ncbi:MAG: type IV pili methyl-accepting chemotaxis transducer N-terminal domain-containing protein [Pseudomonadales bacterium]|nr:type IV pili methyl-accepting chemotaxis transducer N-terminal domain-containing protein [Pseudomonadales bacterium]
MRTIKMHYSVLILFTCFFSVQAIAETLSMGSALNKAGRQRMLTQNITKNYLALGLNVKVVKSRNELDQSVALFEEQFQELVDYAPTSKISHNLGKVQNLWAVYRRLAISPFSESNAIALLEQNNALLSACHQVVVDLEEYAARRSAKMVNVSGRQRMLSQRIAMYYFAHAMGYRSEQFISAFEKAKQEFHSGLKTLQGFNKNTPEIANALNKVNAQWELSQTGFKLLNNSQYVPHVITVTTSGMLKRMDHITKMYEKLDETIESQQLAFN